MISPDSAILALIVDMQRALLELRELVATLRAENQRLRNKSEEKQD